MSFLRKRESNQKKIQYQQLMKINEKYNLIRRKLLKAIKNVSEEINLVRVNFNDFKKSININKMRSPLSRG